MNKQRYNKVNASSIPIVKYVDKSSPNYIQLLGLAHGHGGGGGHHGGGGNWSYGGGYNRGWNYGPEYVVVNQTPACPQILDPVVGSDGNVYMNACLANAAGVMVVRKATKKDLHGANLASVDMSSATSVLLGLGFVAIVLNLLGRKKRA